MKLYLQQSEIETPKSKIKITGSKSESNRLLILQALFEGLSIKNTSNSDDTKVLQKALQTSSKTINVHHAGTSMRFLTAYFATQNNSEITLTGSKQMQKRPIRILVEALQSLGANITYVNTEGYPPLLIKGTEIKKNKVNIYANVSSQYITALLLIAPTLKNGLTLTLKGEITSVPYIKMTLSLLKKTGIISLFKDNIITIQPQNLKNNPQIITVESDWSSASYYYSLIALSKIGTQLKLTSYLKKSLQGDSVLAEIYTQFGVQTTYLKGTILLEKTSTCKLLFFDFQLNKSPDIAQTIAVTCLCLGISCMLTGLKTLKIKETDRLVALKTELEKLGATVNITENSLHLSTLKKMHKNVTIATYQDHRMAMAFAPICLKTPLYIENSEVVSKSYPTFWKDLKKIGIKYK